MNIVSLNAWGGCLLDPLLSFVRESAPSVHAFCFQEVFRDARDPYSPSFGHDCVPDLFERLAKELPGYDAAFSTSYGSGYGIATFVRKEIGILSERTVFTFREGPYAPLEPGLEGEHARAVSVVALGNGVTLANFHGLWRKGIGKDDLPERILQSEILVRSLSDVTGPLALVGDFNLNPETRSVALIEEAGFRNLVREYGVTSTRTRFFGKEWSPFADYAFVRNAEVRDFRVLPDEVSDHAPLYLEIGT